MRVEEIRESGVLEHYVLGILSVEESQQVEQYLVDYPELKEDIRSIQDALQLFAQAKAITPPPGLESKVMDYVKANTSHKPQEPSPPSVQQGASWKWKWCCAALVLGLCGAAWMYYAQVTANRNLLQRYVVLQDYCDSLQQEYQQTRQLWEEINDPAARTLQFAATDGYPVTNLVLHINDVTNRNVLQIKGLPAIADNQAYQLWSLKDGVDPIPLTVFKSGEVLLPVDYEDGTGTYAITIEGEAGATVPTLTRLIGTVGV